VFGESKNGNQKCGVNSDILQFYRYSSLSAVRLGKQIFVIQVLQIGPESFWLIAYKHEFAVQRFM